MNKQKLIKLCLFSEDAAETYPFKEKRYEHISVFRHKSNNKWFAVVFYLNEILYINLKCDPEYSFVLRDIHPFITPAWHMNKLHWIKVEVSKAPEDLLDILIKTSFELTQ